MSLVWLITGASRGLGRTLAKAVLAAGDRLVATARNLNDLDDLLHRYPETLRTAPLDVTDAEAAQAAVKVALDAWGQVDVLVNNAGYGHILPFEQMTPEDFRAQVETNFFGVVHLTRAVLPTMRKQRSGHIFNVSSVGGRVTSPGLSAYQSAKWAVGGFTEGLAQELGSLGIRLTALEPGGMRTDWGFVATGATPDLLPDYQASMGPFLELLSGVVGQETGDPARVAQVVLALARHPNPPTRLLLGSDAVGYCRQVEAVRAAAGAAWEPISLAVDFGAPMPSLPEA